MEQRIYYIIPLALAFLLNGCAGTSQIADKYAFNDRGIAFFELALNKATQDFTYSVRGEMGLLEYASGTWSRQGRKLILSGFNRANLRTLDVAVNKPRGAGEGKLKIILTCKKFGDICKVDLVLNQGVRIPIHSDTAFIPDIDVENIRIKAYLSSEELWGAHSSIDTLYSPQLKPDHIGGTAETIHLKFQIVSGDFSRVMIKDSVVTVKSSNLLIWGKTKFRKA